MIIRIFTVTFYASNRTIMSFNISEESIANIGSQKYVRPCEFHTRKHVAEAVAINLMDLVPVISCYLDIQ